MTDPHCPPLKGPHAVDAATQLAADLLGTRDGWTWHAEPVHGAPRWYAVWQTGPDPLDFLVGGSTYLGPAGLVVTLSSNPAIHGFDQTAQVLNELGLTGLTGDELATEIARRTDQARRARAFD